MIIDTHSHLNFNAFKEDLDEVFERTLLEGIWMINVGTRYETSLGAVKLAGKYKEGVFASVGLHPMYVGAEFVKLKNDPAEGEFLTKEQSFDKEAYKKLVLNGGQKVVAIGEIGLDYYYRPKTAAKLIQFKEKQKQVFLNQLNLAEELNLPVILHCRVAHADILEILHARDSAETNLSASLGTSAKICGMRGVVHCFTGSMEEMMEYIDMGFYIGLNGIIFKMNLDQIIKEIPLNKILVETDCPYLTPPQEGGKRNEPIFIKHTIQKIAELKSVSFEEICEKTTKNARLLFGI